jgi:hypothetical protein
MKKYGQNPVICASTLCPSWTRSKHFSVGKSRHMRQIVLVSHQTCESAALHGDYHTTRRYRPVGILRVSLAPAGCEKEWFCTYAVPRLYDRFEVGPIPGVCSAFGLWTRRVLMSGARIKVNDEPVLSCASAWILARTSAKDDWLFCDADGVGESFCFLVAGSVVVLASRHVAMSKRVFML